MLEAIKMYFLPCLINVINIIYIVKKILDCKFKCKLLSFRTIILIILMTFSMIFSYMFISDYFRFLAATFIITIFSCLLFKDSFHKIIISVFLEQIILIISELIFSLILILFFTNNDIILSSFKGKILTNICIALLSLFIINSKKILAWINNIFFSIQKIRKNNIYLLLYILIFTTNILLAIIYFNYHNIFILIINLFFMFFYSFIVFSLVIESSLKSNYMTENKILLSNLNEYEKMLDYQRVNNHENKNQLLVIKSMVEKEDKKAIEYINEIIKEKREDNELMYTKAKRIPSGGLQGLVYQKMLVMQENYINVILDVSSNVRKIDFSNLSSKMNYDICRIMGIILDNAIEETIKFHRKEREIVISMYIDELFLIEVSNRIKDNIDLEKIYDKGYTNKEKGHGYGLSLLKKIVDKNTNVINELKITNDIFTQIIKIKM